MLKSCGLTTTFTGDQASQMLNIAIVVRIFVSAGNPVHDIAFCNIYTGLGKPGAES